MKVTDEMVWRAKDELLGYTDVPSTHVREALQAALADVPEWPQEMLDERQLWISRACAAEARVKELEGAIAQAHGLLKYPTDSWEETVGEVMVLLMSRLPNASARPENDKP